jgi:hypothetical protein
VRRLDWRNKSWGVGIERKACGRMLAALPGNGLIGNQGLSNVSQVSSRGYKLSAKHLHVGNPGLSCPASRVKCYKPSKELLLMSSISCLPSYPVFSRLPDMGC